MLASRTGVLAGRRFLLVLSFLVIPACASGGVCGGSPASGTTQAAVATPEVLGLLSLASPGVQWDAARSLSVDVDGNGQQDVVAVGTKGNAVVIGTVFGPVSADSKTSVLAFSVGAKTQDSLCSPDVGLALEDPRLPIAEWGCDESVAKPECASARANDEWLRAHELARGVSVDDGKCDALHLYWDATKSSMSWWRR